MVAILPSAFAGFTASQVAQFKVGIYSTCEQITSIQIAALSPSAFSGFTQPCAKTFTKQSLSNIDAEQLSSFTSAAIQGM